MLIKTQYTAVIHDTAWIPITLFLAYWVRYDLSIDLLFETDGWIKNYILLLLLALPVQVLTNYKSGLYRGVWRFASVPDLIRILKSVGFGVIVTFLLAFLFYRLEGVPRTIFILYPLFLVAALAGPRMLYRWKKDQHIYLNKDKRILIVGAGSGGERLARELLRDNEQRYFPVAFVDNDRRRIGQEIHGVRVAGEVSEIPKLVQELSIDRIILAIPTASSQQMRDLMDICEQTSVPVRTLPKLGDLVSGNVSLKLVRDVSIEDLLGRDPVTLDWNKIKHSVNGKIVLVTGGGGSIGSELCRQISRLAPRKLIVIDHSEFNLFEIDKELCYKFPDIKIDSILCSVQDRNKLEQIFSDEPPNVVFHAAAYKHVPLLEHQARAAATNNVLGTKNLADISDKYGCDSFVMISTDKAVNPTNIMGTTKRVAEIYCQNLNKKSKTKFVTVRFGNVLGSTGSVIPIFKEQIAKGGPVTVTHPDIERYFMTIPEASQLIMQSGVLGQGGEIFVLDMGEPVKITYLAEQMITLSGKEPGTDIEISFTGLRPGEKMYEELFHEKESMEKTEHPKIMKAASRIVSSSEIDSVFESIQQACNNNNDEEILENLVKLVPERNGGRNELPSENKVIPIHRN